MPFSDSGIARYSRKESAVDSALHRMVPMGKARGVLLTIRIFYLRRKTSSRLIPGQSQLDFWKNRVSFSIRTRGLVRNLIYIYIYKNPCFGLNRKIKVSPSPEAIKPWKLVQIELKTRQSNFLGRCAPATSWQSRLMGKPPPAAMVWGARGCCPVANSKGLKFDAELFGC